MPLALFLAFTAFFVPSSAYKVLAVTSATLYWMGTHK